MVRSGSFDSNGMKKGAWSEDEDKKLRDFILIYGHCNWRLLPKYAGLKRCGKSCRLRWMNHLKPGVKRGNFSKEEEDLIIKLHSQMGNKWSTIAAELPGRTDNDIKNFWHTCLKRRRSSHSSSTDDQNLVEIHESTNAASDTNFLQFPQMDLWANADANCSQNDGANFPPTLPEEDYFCCPQIYNNDWNIGDEDIHNHSIWDESFEDYHRQPQTSTPLDEGSNYDPIFAYGIHQSL